MLLTNGRSRSSEHLDGLNGRDTTHNQPGFSFLVVIREVVRGYLVQSRLSVASPGRTGPYRWSIPHRTTVALSSGTNRRRSIRSHRSPMTIMPSNTTSVLYHCTDSIVT